jgi:hypothetical protein
VDVATALPRSTYWNCEKRFNPSKTCDLQTLPMRSSGLEPPRTIRSTRPSTLRVYQFRHERRAGEYIRRPAWVALPGCVRPQSALLYEHMFVPGPNPSNTGVAHTWI